MNRTRFYEILQAHKRGEDLSLFVPTNPAEAALIADLQGGGSSNSATLKGYLGETVPNDYTVVTGLYFNTDLTNEEVDQFIANANLTYQDYNGQQIYGILADAVNYVLYGILNFGGAYAIVKLDIYTGSPTDIIYCSTALQSTFGTSGWKSTLNLSTSYSVGSVTSVNEALNYPIGLENNKLKSLVSNTQLEKVEKQLSGEYNGNFAIINDCESNVVNISNLLENNKIPLEIEVNNNSNLIKYLHKQHIDSITLPLNASNIDSYAFYNANVDKIKIIQYGYSGGINTGTMAFQYCKAHTIHLISSGRASSDKFDLANDYIFNKCENLTKLVLDFRGFSETNYTGIFNETPIANGTGYIYVPDDLVDTVKALKGWSTYANQIKPLSEYVEE